MIKSQWSGKSFSPSGHYTSYLISICIDLNLFRNSYILNLKYARPGKTQTVQL